MTLDESPYYNPQVMPMMVQMLRGDSTIAENTESEQRTFDFRLYEDYEMLYRQASQEAFESTKHLAESQRYDAYMTELAHRLCELNVPEEEAFVHIRNHHVYKQI